MQVEQTANSETVLTNQVSSEQVVAIWWQFLC